MYQRKTLDPLSATVTSGNSAVVPLGDVEVYQVKRLSSSLGTLKWKVGTEGNANDGYSLTAADPVDRVECADRSIVITASGGDVVYEIRREAPNRGT